jgi:tetratricopeptide (TPR) repeat protein
MKKKTKLVVVIPGACLAIVILLSIGYYFSGNYYRSHLPANPDFKMVPAPIQEQITEARSKAYYFPTAKNIGELGKVFHSSAYYEKAAVCYKLAVEKSRKVRNNWVWNYYLGYLNLEMGEAKEAIRNFNQVLEKNPGAYQALFYIGEAWQNIGQKENAENIFKRVAGLNNLVSLNQKTNREYYFPIQTYAQFRLARIYLSSNRLDSAETILKDIIAKQWTFGPAYRLLGEVYNKKGKPELGTKYVIRSSDLTDFTPPQDTLIDQIALISRSEKYILKQIDDAKMSCNFNWELRICNQALKYIPDNKYLLANSILLFFTIGKDQDVLPLLPNHLKSYGNDYDEILKVADLLYEKGYRAEAFMYIEQAKKLQPESPGLALWFADHGELGKAITMINSILQKKPDDEEVLTEAVRIYLNSGNKPKLMEYLNRFKKLYPSNLEAQKAMALYYQSEGNEAAGLKIFQELAQSMW